MIMIFTMTISYSRYMSSFIRMLNIEINGNEINYLLFIVESALVITGVSMAAVQKKDIIIFALLI